MKQFLILNKVTNLVKMSGMKIVIIYSLLDIHFAHNKTYGTNIDQGVILLCTKDLMFQRFVVDSERLKKFQKIFLDKVNQYYEMQLNN